MSPTTTDSQLDRLLDNPDKYFEAARERAKAVAERDVARDLERRRAAHRASPDEDAQR